MKMLVTQLEQSRIRGMLLDADVSAGLPAEEFKLWRYASGWSAVVCRLPPITSMGCGVDREGHYRNFINGEVAHTDPLLVGRQVRFDVDGAVEQAPPFLLLSEREGIPGSRQVTVRLHFTRLTDLPDVEGRDEASSESVFDLIDDDLIDDDMRERAKHLRDTDPEWAKAAATPPTMGLCLPFELGSLQGAIRLGERRGEDVFDAVLYVDGDAPIRPGSVLRRRVTWRRHEDGQGSAEADIATVLEAA